MNLIINPSGRTIEDRINPPEGFERIKVVFLSKEMKPVMMEDMEIGDVFRKLVHGISLHLAIH